MKKGERVKIAVGQQGLRGSGRTYNGKDAEGGGGSGGSFVVKSDGSILVIAGGGGGMTGTSCGVRLALN